MIIMSTPAVKGQSVEKILEAVLSTMKAEPYCFLITIDGSGHPHARMMEATSIETDFRVWMITGPETRKIDEIRGNEKAAMAFSDNKGEGYATLSGNARVVNDPAKKKSIWKFEYGAFFPGGPDANDSTLVEFTPHRIEIMHFHLKVGIWPWTMKPACLIRQGKSWIQEP